MSRRLKVLLVGNGALMFLRLMKKQKRKLKETTERIDKYEN